MKNKNNELISVIIPVYNGEKYIKRCVLSVLSQSYKNIEVIIVNDGSSDATLSIVNSISLLHKNVILINNKKSGVSVSRNLGILRAKGEYITFIDSDDFVDSEYINYLYKLIKKSNSDVSLSRYPNKSFLHEMYDVSPKRNLFCKENFESNCYSGFDAAREMLFYKIVISSWNKMYRTDFLKNNKLFFDSNLSFGEGFDFVINCFIVADRVEIGEAKHYYYTIDNSSSVMTSFSEKLVIGSIDSQKCIRNKLVLTRSSKLLNAQNYSYWHTCCDCFNTIIGTGIKDKCKMYNDIRLECKRKSFYAFQFGVPLVDKVKAILFFINPNFASNLINIIRKRKFVKES